MLQLTPAQIIDGDAAVFAMQAAINAAAQEWVTLPLSASSESLFSATVFPAAQSFPIAAGDTVEVEVYYHKLTGAAGGMFLSADASTGYFAGNLSTGHDVFEAIGGSALLDNASSTFTGLHHARFVFNVVSNASVYAWGESDASRPVAAIHDTATNIIGSNVLLYVETDAIAKCAARYRKITAGVFPS